LNAADAEWALRFSRQFAERLAGFENNLYEAAGILLQLLLGTLSSAFEAIDMKLAASGLLSASGPARPIPPRWRNA